jgi:hypothetical protein
MSKYRFLASLGFGVLAFVSQVIIAAMGLNSPWQESCVGAAVSFVAGCFNLMAAGFFGGVAFAVVCSLIPGLFFGYSYDRFMVVVAAPVLVVLVLGVTSMSFFLGKLTNAGARTVGRRFRDQAQE